jgi:LysR family transcriptional regulator, glycine cleavage system transcriptional activator
MSNRRYDLPPLDFVQGFEAAARHLSFTKAADELFITQSAVSRQIKTLEEALDTVLFERRHRALRLTEDGQTFHRIAMEVLDRLQSSIDQMRQRRSDDQLAITTTTGLASLWLIPRLKRFTRANPHVDVRLVANDRPLNLDRSLVDIAIRYAQRETAPKDALPLFGEEILPVCSPQLVGDETTPLRVPADLRHHTLLHLDYPGMQKTWYDWGTWMTALGIEDLRPAGTLHFSRYEQMIQAAISGQGVALGLSPLINEPIRTGQLIAPFDKTVGGSRGYFIIRSSTAVQKPKVQAFCDWLVEEAARDTAEERR